MSLCHSCGKENKVGQRSCYCLASLDIDIDALFLAVQEGSIDKDSLLVVQEEESQRAQSEAEELFLLDDDVLLPVSPRQDYREIHELCAQLGNEIGIEQQRLLLRELSQKALRLSRGLGRVEPIRWGAKPLILFVEGIDQEERWKEMMELLNIPLFRARHLCSTRALNIIHHGEERMVLEALATEYRMMFSSRACVISLAQLSDAPPPMACLGMVGKDFRILDAPLWRMEEDRSLEETISVQPRLAVIGMVEEVHYRKGQYTEVRSFGRRRKEVTRKKSMEKKIGVIDIHCDDVVIRISEGVSDFSTLPGFEKGAMRKSFQRLCSLLSVWIPHIEVVEQRVIHVHSKSDVDMVEHAWDGWERYSYSARRLFFDGYEGYGWRH